MEFQNILALWGFYVFHIPACCGFPPLLPLLLCYKSIKCLSPSTTPSNRFDQGHGQHPENACCLQGQEEGKICNMKFLECQILSSVGAQPGQIPALGQHKPLGLCVDVPELQPQRAGRCLVPAGTAGCQSGMGLSLTLL